MLLFKKNTDHVNHYTPDKTLSELATMFETDKGTANSLDLSWGKDYPNHVCMHYTNTYEKYMEPIRTKDLSMMEIGVCDKRFPYASINMWLRYFQNVDFYAMDNFWGHTIDDKLGDVRELTDRGVNFVYADQGSFVDWNQLNNMLPDKFDLIVEDGSHWPNHMMISLWKSIGLLKTGGYYFMEDIQNPLKSRGWFKYDNSLLGQELLETLSTKILHSSFLNDTQNSDIQNNLELVDLVLDPSQVTYLAVFKKI